MEGNQLESGVRGIDLQIYGVRFILPRQNFSARLSGQDQVEGMIFGSVIRMKGKSLTLFHKKSRNIKICFHDQIILPVKPSFIRLHSCGKAFAIGFESDQ